MSNTITQAFVQQWDTMQTYHRDGMRRVVEFIVTQINRANGVDTEQENEQ